MRADRRAPAGRRVVVIVVGLVLLAGGIAAAVLLGGGDEAATPIAQDGREAEPTEADPTTAQDDASPEQEASEDASDGQDPADGQELLADDLNAPGDGEDAPESDPESATEAEDADSVDDTPIIVGFDGQCEVTVPLNVAQEEQLRAWDFPECTGAPVSLAIAEERWIVVVASLNGDDFTEADARQRAARDAGDGVLWSSHYPSLNPNLWVVFDGPFLDEATAREAADRRGGGAYQRVLSDDDGDRYCLAADGCVGERDQ